MREEFSDTSTFDEIDLEKPHQSGVVPKAEKKYKTCCFNRERIHRQIDVGKQYWISCCFVNKRLIIASIPILFLLFFICILIWLIIRYPDKLETFLPILCSIFAVFIPAPDFKIFFEE